MMNSSDNPDNNAYAALLSMLTQVHQENEMDTLLTILLTPSEQKELVNRLRIFILIAQGVTQREIAEKIGVGIATVSRGARAYKQYKLDEKLPFLRSLDGERIMARNNNDS